MRKTLLAVPLIFILACRAKEANMPSDLDTFMICAHRGASAHAPENTLAAMRLAMEMGAHMCEIDVQQTRDDRLVLLHDEELDRTSNGTGFLWQKSLSELQGIDAGSWFDAKYAGEPLPTLEEAMDLVRGKMKLNVEVKLHGHERQIAPLIVAAIRRANFQEECIVTSFGHAVAEEIKKLAPELQVGYIFGTEEYHEGLFTGEVDLLSAHHHLISPEFMRKARAGNKQVHVWTVNDKPLMRRMLELGVAAIITNYPDRLAEVVREKE